MKIPFCLPLIDKDVNKEVLSCLNETGWLTTGLKVKLLEDEITGLCQTNSTICVNSWTSGMLLLIRWLDLDEDDIEGNNCVWNLRARSIDQKLHEAEEWKKRELKK